MFGVGQRGLAAGIIESSESPMGAGGRGPAWQRAFHRVPPATVPLQAGGLGATSPVVSEWLNGAESVAYTPGISERRGTTSTWSHGGLKNFDYQSRSDGSVASARRYDAFGDGNTQFSGHPWIGPFGYGGPFGYYGTDYGPQPIGLEAGYTPTEPIKEVGHRWYDPSIGRFLSRDPAESGRNWFAYCDNDPISNVDPTGCYDERIYSRLAKYWGKKIADWYKKDKAKAKSVDLKVGKRKRRTKTEKNPDISDEALDEVLTEEFGKSEREPERASTEDDPPIFVRRPIRGEPEGGSVDPSHEGDAMIATLAGILAPLIFVLPEWLFAPAARGGPVLVGSSAAAAAKGTNRRSSRKRK